MHPALSPVLGHFLWLLRMARISRGFWLHQVANPPNTLAKAVAWVGSDVRGGLVWLNSPTAYSFVMISPNLLAIWVFLFLNLSQDLKLVLLRYFGTLGDG
jgi:hypothetical protein